MGLWEGSRVGWGVGQGREAEQGGGAGRRFREAAQGDRGVGTWTRTGGLGPRGSGSVVVGMGCRGTPSALALSLEPQARKWLPHRCPFPPAGASTSPAAPQPAVAMTAVKVAKSSQPCQPRQAGLPVLRLAWPAGCFTADTCRIGQVSPVCICILGDQAGARSWIPPAPGPSSRALLSLRWARRRPFNKRRLGGAGRGLFHAQNRQWVGELAASGRCCTTS